MDKHKHAQWFKLSDIDGNVSISSTVGPDWCSPEHYVGRVRKEHAALIAAAPELLEALAGCITEPGAHCYVNAAGGNVESLERRLVEINRAARAAIALATGKD